MVKDRKLGMLYWIKVLMLLVATGALTWYAKRPAQREALRNHGTAVWVTPSPQGLSSLIVLSDDGVDSNQTQTGARFWFRPPESPKAFETQTPALYRGPTLAVFDSSLTNTTWLELASTVDTGGILYHSVPPSEFVTSAVPIRFREFNLRGLGAEGLPYRVGNDVMLESGAGMVGFAWNGYRIRWWSSITAMEADTSSLPISLGILADCLPQGEVAPHTQDSRIRTFVFCGGREESDSSRISLHAGEAFTLIEDRTANTLMARRIHLPN